MNWTNATPPTLCAISQCKKDLDFQPVAHWPRSLPAVAVNGWVLAGFNQDLVFNHVLLAPEMNLLPGLFRSLHSELSFVEVARLWAASKSLDWFPFAAVAQSYGSRVNKIFERMSACVLCQPIGFQNWCAEKKLTIQELAPLMTAEKFDLKPIQLRILQLNMSKTDGALALNLCANHLIQGRPPSDLRINPLETEWTAETWLNHLQGLVNPNHESDLKGFLEKNLAKLPWPGSSQAKWVQQGSVSGIELKLFVGRPEDLKKYASSFEKIQKLLEDNEGELWKEQ